MTLFLQLIFGLAALALWGTLFPRASMLWDHLGWCVRGEVILLFWFIDIALRGARRIAKILKEKL